MLTLAYGYHSGQAVVRMSQGLLRAAHDLLIDVVYKRVNTISPEQAANLFDN